MVTRGQRKVCMVARVSVSMVHGSERVQGRTPIWDLMGVFSGIVSGNMDFET